MIRNNTIIKLDNGSEIIVPEHLNDVVMEAMKSQDLVSITLTIGDNEYHCCYEPISDITQLFQSRIG